MRITLDLDDRTYQIISREAQRRGLSGAEELMSAWILEKAMEEVHPDLFRVEIREPTEKEPAKPEEITDEDVERVYDYIVEYVAEYQTPASLVDAACGLLSDEDYEYLEEVLEPLEDVAQEAVDRLLAEGRIKKSPCGGYIPAEKEATTEPIEEEA